MKQKAIGVFDSGLGGLTVVRELVRQMPHEDIIYFGDTGRVPYGTKSNHIIEKYATQDIRFLLSKNVKMIIAACGTVSSVAPHLGDTLDIPYTGVVEHAARRAAELTRSGNIGVLGTTATIRSGSYQRALTKLDSSLGIHQTDCPLFVPLVENNMISPDDPVPLEIARRYLAPILAAGVDTLILGCTHYPLLAPVISKLTGNGVRLVDAGEETALYTYHILKQSERLGSAETGERSFFVSDRIDNFTQVASLYLDMDVGGVIEKIDIESYESGGRM